MRRYIVGQQTQRKPSRTLSVPICTSLDELNYANQILNSIGTDSQKRLYWHFGHTYRIWRETVFPDDSSWEAVIVPVTGNSELPDTFIAD